MRPSLGCRAGRGPRGPAGEPWRLPTTPLKTPIPPSFDPPGFAFDGGFVPHGAVVPTRGLVKHAHDGVVVPTEDHTAELEAMGERQQTRELEALVSRHAILAIPWLYLLCST